MTPEACREQADREPRQRTAAIFRPILLGARIAWHQRIRDARSRGRRKVACAGLIAASRLGRIGGQILEHVLGYRGSPQSCQDAAILDFRNASREYGALPAIYGGGQVGQGRVEHEAGVRSRERETALIFLVSSL
jgi:hypothetical protein